nr:hypothetical protein Iba_chr12cCG21990 [Ipomoea batatas]
MFKRAHMTYRDTNSQGEGKYIAKLEMAELAEISNGVVSGLDGDDELHEGHLLGAHQIHRRQVVYVLHFLPTKHAPQCISPDLVITPDLYTFSPSLPSWLLSVAKLLVSVSLSLSPCLSNCRVKDQVNPLFSSPARSTRPPPETLHSIFHITGTAFLLLRLAPPDHHQTRSILFPTSPTATTEVATPPIEPLAVAGGGLCRDSS